MFVIDYIILVNIELIYTKLKFLRYVYSYHYQNYLIILKIVNFKPSVCCNYSYKVNAEIAFDDKTEGFEGNITLVKLRVTINNTNRLQLCFL